MELHGKHVIVTGAAGGIGRALAERFHAGGATVVGIDLSAAAVDAVAATMNATRPDSALGVAADVGTEAGNRELIHQAQVRFGAIDLFFANAGVGVGQGVDASEADWETSFNVNIHAHRWAAKYLLPGWLARGEGYFCSTASAAGLLTQIGSVPYSVTKHAAVAFAEWLSVTYGDKGLRVSCLCPMGVNTNMLNQGDGLAENGSSDVVRAAGAVLEPEEVAEIVVRAIADETFLITPHAEVLTFWQRKTTDYDRWIAGMRRLQARVVG